MCPTFGRWLNDLDFVQVHLGEELVKVTDSRNGLVARVYHILKIWHVEPKMIHRGESVQGFEDSRWGKLGSLDFSPRHKSASRNNCRENQ